MPLTKFNEDDILHVCGLQNTGSICYLNSFVQSLLSCTSITRFFLDNRDRYTTSNNKVALAYIKLIDALIAFRDLRGITRPGNDPELLEVYNKIQLKNNNFSRPVTLSGSGIFHEIMSIIKSKYPNKKFGAGQEDSGEGLTLFLDAIDDPKLYDQFMHNVQARIYCTYCKKDISANNDKSCIFEVPQKLLGFSVNPDSEPVEFEDPLNMHIRQSISMLNDYKCPECKNNKCFIIYSLAGTSSLITVMFNKFMSKKNISYPPDIYFPIDSGKFIQYKAVASVEHSGHGGGGHYWAKCLRRNINNGVNIHELNDARVSASDMEPCRESYIIFYHYMGEVSTPSEPINVKLTVECKRLISNIPDVTDMSDDPMDIN